MQNALPVYGLQHCTDDINADMQKILQYWPTFWNQLKNAESFLMFPERRKRFISSCMEGTPYIRYERHIEKFSASLYEKRWHEVVRFTSRLTKLMCALVPCWDHRKYLAATDMQRSAAEGGDDQEAEHGGAGKQKFDPELFTKTLQDPMFHRYCVFVEAVQGFSKTHLASWGEGCPCHDPLLQMIADVYPSVSLAHSQNLYHRRKLFRKHYDGFDFCPMAGKRAPELAAGRLSQVIAALWANMEYDVLCGESARYHPLPPDKHELLKQELHNAQAYFLALLKTKLDYWNKLPWLLCALALPREGSAREWAVRILELFDMDPRPPPVHHRITYRLLHPGAEFREQLQRFIGGVPRWECSTAFQEQIAAFYFIPVVETTIEQKHARVKLAEAHHHIGETRVSLSNRMRWIHRFLHLQPESLPDFLDAFENTRSIGNISSLFDLDCHPLLVNKKSLSKLEKIIKRYSIVQTSRLERYP